MGILDGIATYSVSTSSQVATGYVTTAEYKGEVVAEGVENITYTVVYVGSEIIPAEPEPTEPVQRALPSFVLPIKYTEEAFLCGRKS